jgi:hypothetical protein
MIQDMSNLYTMIIEFGGSTYVSQSEGLSPDLALRDWNPATNDSGNQSSLLEISRLLQQALNEGDSSVPILGVKNVWCISGSCEGNLFLVHVVLTTRAGRLETEGKSGDRKPGGMSNEVGRSRAIP